MSRLLNYTGKEKSSEAILKDYECDGQMSIFDYEPRNPGEIVTHETRALSHETVDKQRRYKQIVETMNLFGRPMTAKEIAVHMCAMGYIPTAERNFTAPRLTEMSKTGLVEPAGKTYCRYTGKKVTAYKLLKEAIG